ncbi:MAG: methylated-DNA--[protein]-cysteine S-methyltransferase [Gemmatimonadota bacterium]
MSELDYQRIERAIRYLDENAAEQPDLKRLAAEVGLSEFHFQRLFRRWAGVSPKRFLQFVTAGAASRELEDRAVLDASYGVGLSGSGRLHDLLVAVNAVTPGEMKSGGQGLEIGWGIHPTPFGECLIGVTGRGICEMSFISNVPADDAVAELASRWPAATLTRSQPGTGKLIETIFANSTAEAPITLLLRGTNFQLQVWRALLEIPPGGVTTYGAIARSMGAPTASRAVGSAIGANRIAYLIPCHRVVRGTYGFGNYRWGVARKKAILAWEAFRQETGAQEPNRPQVGAMRST